MRAGVLGVADGDFEYVDSFSDTVQDGDDAFDRCLDIKRVFSLPSGDSAFAGVAAREVQRSQEVADIDDGGVEVSTETRTETVHTRFAGVPGEFAVVASSSGTFAFDLLGLEADVAVERGTLDLEAVFESAPGARPWRAGIAGGGDGVNGVFHGADLRENRDFERLREGGTLNQLGLEYGYEGSDLKMTATRSGYVEVYQPSSFEVGEYLAYLRAEILPHLSA